MGGAGRAGTGGGGASSGLHRPNPQRPASSVTRTSFEELYRQSPMPKVIAAGGRVVRPSPNRSRPSVPAFDASPRSTAGGGAAGVTAAAAARAAPSMSSTAATRSPTISRSSQTKTTTLVEWSIRRVTNESDAAEEHFVVQGVDTVASAAGPRVSSPIAVRAAPRQLMTESENIYKLEGKPEEGAMAAAVEMAFAQGLTKDWKKLLGGSTGAAVESVEDTVSDSGSDDEDVSLSNAVRTGKSQKKSSKSNSLPKQSPRPPTEAEAREKARAIAAAQSTAARQARSTTEAQQRLATSSVMSSFDDVETGARGRSSRTSGKSPNAPSADSDTSPAGTRRKSLIVTKKGRAPPPAPAPAPKPRRPISEAVARAAKRAAAKAEEEAAAAEVLKLDEMPVTSSGRRRVPPLPFWANSRIRRDREFNVLSATSGREVLLTAGAKDERAVLQPGAAAAAAVLPRATTDLQDRVEEAAAAGASSAKESRSGTRSEGSRSQATKRKSRRSSTDGSSKKNKKKKKEKEKRRRKKEKAHRVRTEEPEDEDEESDKADGAEDEAGGEGQAAAGPSSHSVSSGMSSIKFMSVKELKAQLDEKGVDHSACIEKQDLVDLLRLYWGVVISKPKSAHGKRGKPKGRKTPSASGPSKRISKRGKAHSTTSRRRAASEEDAEQQAGGSGPRQNQETGSDTSATSAAVAESAKPGGGHRVKKTSNKAKAAAAAVAADPAATSADSTSGPFGSQHEEDDAVVPDSEEEADEANSAPVCRVSAPENRPKSPQPVAASSVSEDPHVEAEERALPTDAPELAALKDEYFRVLGKQPRGRFQNSAKWLQEKVEEANVHVAEEQSAEVAPQGLLPSPDRDATASPLEDAAPVSQILSPAMARPRRTPSKPARFKDDDDVTSSAGSASKQPAQAQHEPAGWSMGAKHALSAAFASTAPTRPNFWKGVSEKLVAAGHRFSAAECQAEYDSRFGSPQAAGSARKKHQPASSNKKQRRDKRGGASGTTEDDSTASSSFGSFIAAASEKAAAATKPPPRKGTMANRRRLRGMLEDADAAHDGDDLFNSPRALGRDGFVQIDNDEVKARPRRAVAPPTRFAEENIPASHNWREVQAQKEAEEAAAAEAARLSTRTRRKSVDELLSKSPAAANRASGGSTGAPAAVMSPAKSNTSEKKVDQLQDKYEETLGKRPRGKLAR